MGRKILLICLSFLSLQLDAQENASVPPQVWVGVRIRPLGLHKSGSSAIEYVVQTTNVFFHLHPSVKFGFASWEQPVLSTHDVNYRIVARFIKPGFTFFLPTRNLGIRFYIAPGISFCEMQHDMSVHIKDDFWGNSTHVFSNVNRVISFELDWGGIFQLYKRLYCAPGFTVCKKHNNVNPFPNIYKFDYPGFTPGSGFGTDVGFDIYIGLIFRLN